MTRQIEGEDAAVSRVVADVDLTVVGVRAPLADGQSQAEAGPVVAELGKGPKELLGFFDWQAPALILDVDLHAVDGGDSP